MFGPSRTTSRSQQAWIRAVIFVGLYLLLFLSFTQCALVLYLYGTAQVDGLMTPSLIIGLIASFLSVPFVVIRTVLSWQYRRASGLGLPRTALHVACSNLPRVMVAMWLAASVAGLVVVSKQAACDAPSATQQYWKAGLSCQIHRTCVILEILAFVSSSALFFCLQVCERPYDTSILGVYAPQRPSRNGSILSGSSWESETLKNEILYLCRHPDAGPGNGELYWSPNDSSLFEKPVRPPSIRYPGPTRIRPQLHLNTHTNSIRPSIVAADSVVTDASSKSSSIDGSTARSVSLRTDISPLSRNPSQASTLQLFSPEVATLTRSAAVPPVPSIPEIPEMSVPSQAGSKHTRQKSSVSSRKFLPKDWLSEPLSEDPQIRALASPPGSPEIEAVSPSTTEEENGQEGEIPKLPSLPAPIALPAGLRPSDDSPHKETGLQTRRRSMTAPGNPPPVLPPVPLNVRKSNTSHINSPPRSIHHPHHPNYDGSPAMTPKMSAGEGLNKPLAARTTLASLSNSNHNIMTNRQPVQRQKSTSISTRVPPRRQLSMGYGHHHPHPNSRFQSTQPSLSAHGSIKDLQRARSSSSIQNTQFPLRAPSHNLRLNPRTQQYQPQWHHYHHQYNVINRHHSQGPTSQPQSRPRYPRRFHSNDGRGFDPAHTLPPIPRSDDNTATVYPSTRRPRNSTYGSLPNSSATNQPNNNGAVESAGSKRTSLSLADGGVALEEDRDILERRNTYRGAERTSTYMPLSGVGPSR